MSGSAGWGDSLRRALYAGKIRLQVARSNSEVERAFGAAVGPGPAQYGMAVGAMGAVTLLAMMFLMSGSGGTEVREAQATIVRPSTPANRVVAAPMIPPASTVQEPDDLLIRTPASPDGKGLFAAVDLNRLPRPAYVVPQPDPSALHTLVVDKSRKELLVLEETRENFRVVERFPISIGPKPGDKFTEGDLATPEGLYQVLSTKEGPDLPGKYGPRAYVLNYPNRIDRAAGKSGYGIWIHGSGLGLATEDTEGCVEVNDENIMKLGSYIATGTPVYIFPDGFETPVENGVIQKSLVRPETVYGLKEYRNATLARLEAR
ncbi:MAG: L,D-transpeptidase family protein [Nitrospinae bacterium]|nr:L,D-transpeptidase family protein [Nitrospinota bacterium]